MQSAPSIENPPASRLLWAIGGLTTLLLLLVAGRYGYHRDELYFLAGAKRLDWGYVDQPPLTPFLALALDTLFPDSLLMLRSVSAVSGGLVVVITGHIARTFGADRSTQLLAAGCMAVSSILLGVFHLLSTSSLDFLAWTIISWLIARALIEGQQKSWLVAGAVAGLALQNKSLIAFYVVGLIVCIAAVGPRVMLRNRWFGAGVVITSALWAPNILWQAANGWPQLALADAIANGSSGTSEPRHLFIPFQIVLVSPLLAPIWIAGLVRLIRDPILRPARAFAFTYALLLLVFMTTGGKPYYLAGMYPVLLAAGSSSAMDWMRRKASRTWLVGAALVMSAGVSSTLMLPILPVSALHKTPVPAINYDAGETVGWPSFVRTMAYAHASLPEDLREEIVILAGNYGEAGAIEHFGDDYGLPKTYSGHNAYFSWGQPPEGTTAALAVGLPEQQLRSAFTSVVPISRVDNGLSLDNDEQHEIIWLCQGPKEGWAELWPSFRNVG